MKKYLLSIAACMLSVLDAYSFIQTVTVQDHVFTPSSFTINFGDTVRWTWLNGSHTTTSLTIPAGAASWDHAINSTSTSFTYKPSVSGTYGYKCTPHFSMGMTGSFTVNCPQASVQIAPGSPTTFCKGGSVLLYSNVSTNIISYQWKNNGTNISGATNSTYNAKATGSYTLTVTNNCGSTAVSGAVSVTVNVLPNATITPSDTVYKCMNDSLALHANTGTSLTYQWKRGTTNISGATSSVYKAVLAGFYKVIVTKTTTGCSKTSPSTRVINNCREQSIAENDDDVITIYPNPSYDAFHIITPFNSTGAFILTIFDVTGKLHAFTKSIQRIFHSDKTLGRVFILLK
jgi:plastocyanin